MGAAATPPRGWNAWNAFRTEVDEAKVMGWPQTLRQAEAGFRASVRSDRPDGADQNLQLTWARAPWSVERSP